MRIPNAEVKHVKFKRFFFLNNSDHLHEWKPKRDTLKTETKQS